MIENIAIYCASGQKIDSVFFDEAAQLGRWIGLHQKRLVYGGANVGLMEEVASQVKISGGKITGVITNRICEYGKASLLPDEMIRVETLSERKQRMMELADVFIALPGGFGTLDEIFDVLAAGQLGYHEKKLILCNSRGFYDSLLDQLGMFYKEHFASPNYLDYYITVSGVDECIDLLEKMK